jgi:hypothetical protein
MIRWLLIALFIYLVYKLIRGPGRNKRRDKDFRFGSFKSGTSKNRGRNNNLDQIEEAEFEDITHKEKKADNR